MHSNFKIRLVTKVAKLYYEESLLQKEIAKKLHLSQATVSRLLQTAVDQKIVKTSVSVPTGVFSDLEEKIEKKYNLKDVIIADTNTDSSEEILRSIGSAASSYLETVLNKNEVIGISSWSTTLLSTVNSMQPQSNRQNIKVVQILGGMGNPAAETHANHMIKRLANLVNGEAIFLPAPGVTPKGSSPEIYKQDEFVKKAINMFDKVTLALVGIGTMEPSKLLAISGNVFSENELVELKEKGAIGDICLHFFNKDGVPIRTELQERVISMDLDHIKNVDRAVAIAGGKNKVQSIKAALIGQYVNVLITDRYTAKAILA